MNGRQVDRSLLCSVVDISDDQIDDVIDELEDALVLEPWGRTARAFALRFGICGAPTLFDTPICKAPAGNASEETAQRALITSHAKSNGHFTATLNEIVRLLAPVSLGLAEVTNFDKYRDL